MFCLGAYLIKLSLLITLIVVLHISFLSVNALPSSDFSFHIDVDMVSYRWIGSYYEWDAIGYISGEYDGTLTWFERGIYLGDGNFDGIIKGVITLDNNISFNYQVGNLINPYKWRTIINSDYQYSMTGNLFVDDVYVCKLFGFANGDWFHSSIDLRCV